MLLRESSGSTGELDLGAVTEPSRDSGMARGAPLNALVEAVIGRHWTDLAKVCRSAEPLLGAEGVRDALIVAAGFNGITRVADATGIPLDPSTTHATRELRARTGIDRFDYAAKTRRYDPR